MVLLADLDGVVLEAATPELGDSARTLARFRVAGGALVLVTGKTLAEVSPLWQRFALDAPFAIEMGAAIYVPRDLFPRLPAGTRARADGPFDVIAISAPRARIVAELGEAAREVGATIRGFAGMSLSEAASITGLSREMAARAMTRAYSEPFALLDGDASRLEESLASRGLRLTRGERFFHAHGPFDKGTAARLIVRCYRESFGEGLATAAIGSAPDDLPVFQAVDRGFVLPGLAGRHHGAIVAAGAVPIEVAGPRGFAMAIDALLEVSSGGS